jgi:hypothetical protein
MGDSFRGGIGLPNTSVLELKGIAILNYEPDSVDLSRCLDSKLADGIEQENLLAVITNRLALSIAADNRIMIDESSNKHSQ